MPSMELRNTYWLLRHGRSTANEADLIVSTLENGTQPQWGLSEAGRAQAQAAGAGLLQQLAQHDAAALFVYSSPFSRTVETAELAAAPLAVAPGDAQFQLAPELRERGFGAYEMQPCSCYEAVWAEDASSTATRPPGGGESVEDVAARLTAFIVRLEARHQGCHLVLVSHGDALSILAAALQGADLGQHRRWGLPNCGVLRLPPAAAGPGTDC